MVRSYIASILRRFRSDEQGNIALLMGLLALPMVGAVGYGLDYARTANHKAALNSAASAASLAAIDTARAMILANVNATTSAITAAASARALQVFNGQAPAGADISYSPPTIVTSRVGNTLNANVTYSATITTTLSKVMGVSKMAVTGGNGSIGNLTDGTSSNPDIIIDENFDKFTGSLEYGAWGVRVDYNNWKTTGSGVEIGNKAPYGAPTPPNGAVYMAELDSFSNSSISKKIYLNSGNYELRYYSFSRVEYVPYDPAWICGSRTEDVSWASGTAVSEKGRAWGYQSNRIGVYLTPAPNDVSPAIYAPASHDMIDVCVLTGGNWIERSIKITMNTPGFYWLAFQAEGQSDGYGGLVTGIRLCKTACAGTPQENFPWSANQLLFSDGFETPAGLTTELWTERTLDASGTNTGWPLLPPGWTTHPYNQADFQPWGSMSGAEGGLLAIELDASGLGANLSRNRSVSRKMILPPGNYQLKYNYFSMPWWGTGGAVACGLTNIANQEMITRAQTSSDSRNLNWDTAKMGVYIDPDLNVSHPESEVVLRAPSVWKNADGSAATKPQLPINAVDACMYSKQSTTRTVNFKIVKPGFYWVTFRGEGAEDTHGANIDLVSLTALGGPLMSPPTGLVTIPSPGLAIGNVIAMNGFQIISQ